MIIGDTLWGILLCGLIAILCAIFIHRCRKIDKYVEEDAEECSVNSEIDYVKCPICGKYLGRTQAKGG